MAANRTRTRAERFLDIRLGKVILLAPMLPAAAYQVEAQTSFNENGHIRGGKLEAQRTAS